MKALVYTAVGAVEIMEMPEHVASMGEVKIKVEATGICGSDVHGFLGHSSRRLPGLILGHETLGRVESWDAALTGKRVSVNPLNSCQECAACRSGRHNCCTSWRLLGMDTLPGGFAEYIVVPRRNVHILPDDVSAAEAVMVEPLANAFHLLSMIPPTAGVLPTIAILGSGTLGACIISVAKARGLQIVAVAEPNPERAKVAKALGATNVIDPTASDVAEAILEATDGVGVSVVIDAVGRAGTRNTAARAVARGGTALLLGLDEGPTSFDFYDLVRREVRLQTSFAYTESDFAQALRFVTAKAADFQPWTEVMNLEEGQRAFDKLVHNRGDRIKIALVP